VRAIAKGKVAEMDFDDDMERSEHASTSFGRRQFVQFRTIIDLIQQLDDANASSLAEKIHQIDPRAPELIRYETSLVALARLIDRLNVHTNKSTPRNSTIAGKYDALNQEMDDSFNGHYKATTHLAGPGSEQQHENTASDNLKVSKAHKSANDLARLSASLSASLPGSLPNRASRVRRAGSAEHRGGRDDGAGEVSDGSGGAQVAVRSISDEILVIATGNASHGGPPPPSFEALVNNSAPKSAQLQAATDTATGAGWRLSESSTSRRRSSDERAGARSPYNSVNIDEFDDGFIGHTCHAGVHF